MKGWRFLFIVWLFLACMFFSFGFVVGGISESVIHNDGLSRMTDLEIEAEITVYRVCMQMAGPNEDLPLDAK